MALQQNIKPRYEVHRNDTMVTETRYRRNEDGINEAYTVEVPYGYDVYFPAGHSIRVATDKELQRLGFEQPPDLIDMDSGESVGTMRPLSLKQQVQRHVSASKGQRADTTSQEAS